MIPQEIYRILHVVGLGLTLAAIGAAAGSAKSLGMPEGKSKAWAIAHGVGLFLVLVAGFGLMARTEVEGYPLWIIIKLVMFLGLGVCLTLAYKIAPKRPMVAIIIPLILMGLASAAAKYLREPV